MSDVREYPSALILCDGLHTAAPLHSRFCLRPPPPSAGTSTAAGRPPPRYRVHTDNGRTRLRLIMQWSSAGGSLSVETYIVLPV
jgi:hypothetical protein